MAQSACALVLSKNRFPEIPINIVAAEPLMDGAGRDFQPENSARAKDRPACVPGS
jgi:hypothetical protein